MLQNPSGRLKDQLCTGSDAQRWVGTVGLAVAVGIAYFLTAQLGRTLLTNSEGLAVFWLGSGVAVGVLVVLGGGARVAVVAGVISASLAINLLGGTSILGAFAFAICNASEAVLAAWLIERWSGPTFRVGKLRHVMALFVAAGVAPAVASAGAAVAMTLLGPSDAPLLSIWRVWFAADALGIVSTAPLLIGVGAVLRDAPPWRDLLEGTLAVLVIAVTNAVALALLAGPWSLITPASFLVPPLLWLGSRYRPEFAAVAAFAITVTIVWTTTHAIGRYGDLSQPIDIRIVAAQISMLGIALAALGLASLFAERRQNEQALSESMQRLQLALDATELGVWSVDLTTGSVEIDSRGRLLHGFDTNTRPLTIEEARRVVHPNDLPNLNAMFGATQLAGAVHSCEYRVVLPTSHPHAGEVRCVAVMGRIGEDGTRWNGIVRDITESKPAEEAIKQSEARLQEALTAGEVMAFEWNLRTGLSQRSENTSQILGAGLRPDANDFMARVHPEDWAH